MLKRVSRNIEDFFLKTPIQLLEMKATVCQMKNALGGINGRSAIAEEKPSKFEDGTIENIQNEKQNKFF